jgi:DNA-binding NtrC family response regulator
MSTPVLIDEVLPDDPLEAEVVLHVRRHLRDSIRAHTKSAAEDLAMLFGLPRTAGRSGDWVHAAGAKTPIAEGARLQARKLGTSIVPLGRDTNHLRECGEWLAARKVAEPAYRDIAAPDLTTLLTLSRARDAAVARAHGPGDAQRFLPVVIVGPTGTGKELLARAVHEIWAREHGASGSAFHPLHLAGMPSHLIYGELFGHEAGAFTDAKKSRAGRIVSADKGTLFIDEIGDLPAEAQVALLRFLQDGSLSALGRDDTRRVNVRIVAATWHDLERDVAEGRFRADLFHRLHAGSALRLDALKHRRVPLRALVMELIERKKHAASPPVSVTALDALDRCDWPGNLRELDGVLDEALSAARGGTVRLDHLPSQIVQRYLALPAHERALGTLADEVDDGEVTAELVDKRIERLADSIRRHAPAEATRSRRVHLFLAQLADPSAEHQAAVREAAEAVALEDEAEHAQRLAKVLATVVATPDAPDVVLRVAKARLDKANSERRKLLTRVSESLGKIDREHPWLRVYRELAELPILQGQANGEVAHLIQFALRAIVSFWPQGLALLRAKATKQGAAGVFQEIVKHLPAESDSDSDGESVLSHRDRPGLVTKDEWEDVVAASSSLADAARRTRFSEKQIKTCLKKHGVEARWGKPRTVS